jgi:hypothetical protein
MLQYSLALVAERDWVWVLLQVVKIWDVVPHSRLQKWADRLSKMYRGYTQQHVLRCAVRRMDMGRRVQVCPLHLQCLFTQLHTCECKVCLCPPCDLDLDGTCALLLESMQLY